jgi:hypothetical protein
MNGLHRRRLLQLSTMAILVAMPLFAPSALFAQGSPKAEAATNLFKVVTVKDEIVVGVSASELDQFGGNDAGAIARTLVAKGTLTLWQYAVRKASNGDLEQAPLRKIALMAHSSLRVEPFSTPLKVLPYE